jgi:hypothetical protein
VTDKLIVEFGAMQEKIAELVAVLVDDDESPSHDKHPYGD